MVFTGVSGIFVLAIWYTSTSRGSNITVAVLYGFSSGPFFSLLAVRTLFRLKHPTSDLLNLKGRVASISPVERLDTRIGILFAVLSTGALAGSPTAGLFVKMKDR